MKFKVKVLQKRPHRTSNERDDLLKESEVTMEEIVGMVYKLLYGLGVECRVEIIED